jgi:CheY-like chemotaxis protein
VAYTRLTVSDTGQGMDQETQRRAFEPFFTTKQRGKGTGLGLASVYGVIRAAGGRVSLHSEPGTGTTVKVFLPAVPARDGSVPEDSVPAAAPEPAHILAVEDEDEVAELLQLLLESAGMTVTVVTEPTQALARFHHGDRVDLLITDVIMPQMTGPELVDVLHAERPDLPVLYMSGYTAGMLGERGRVAPGTELIEKPFTRGALLAAVSRALGSHAAPAVASAKQPFH